MTLPNPSPSDRSATAGPSVSTQAPAPKPNAQNGGNDAVCFTAGFAGAMFGVGTIHAYLASDRDPPAVVAGISAGAINAAAMQRCYQELRKSQTPGGLRWKWFRQYLSTLTDDPLGVIWRGLPRLTDFSADLPPVQDTSIGTLGADEKTNAYWMDQEKRARRELFLFMRLADWLARLPLTISLLATAVVDYVRLTEKIPEWRILRVAKYSLLKLYIALVLVVHTAFHPFWFKESRFKTSPRTEIRFYKPSYWLRPLLGWRIYLLAWIVLLFLAELTVGIALGITPKTTPIYSYMARAMEIIAVAALAIVYTQRRPIQRSIWTMLLPLVKSHARRLAWVAFFASGMWALVIVNNRLLNSGRLQGRWISLWDYTLFPLAFFCSVALLVVLSFETVVIIATLSQKGRSRLDKCKHPTLWCAVLIIAEALSVLANVYFVKSLILKAIFATLSVICGTVLLSFVAFKALPLLRGFSQRHLHPLVAFMLQAPWTNAVVTVQACSLALIVSAKYRWWAEFCFVALLGLESFAIAAKVILRRKPEQIDEPPAGKQTMRNRIQRWISTQVFRNLEMERALIHKFQLLLRLTRLFGHDGTSDRLTEDPMPLVIVAAPLQTMPVGVTRRGVSQVWARKGIRIVDALATAVAIPGIYEPSHFDRDEFPEDATDIAYWEMENPPRVLDLVDGARVRENPLPALFQFLRRPGRESLAETLSSNPSDPRVHIVFTVPLGEHQGSLKPGPLGLNIVDVAFASLRLNRRRDSELEIQQTNFMSALELVLEQHANERPISRHARQRLYPIFADTISPEDDLSFANPLRPDAEKVLQMAASGCRRTLEIIYRKELQTFQPEVQEVSCSEFVSTITRDRDHRVNPSKTPGLPEVCGACTCKLRKSTAPVTTASSQEDLQPFAHLNGKSPRIVFLASGGVFRGSFHAGMLACLLSTDIRPDVIVGASVGTLMGGALGAMLTARNADGQMDYSLSLRLLSELVDALIYVDKRIAFTRVLKTAIRDFGIRARGIKLSPNQIRRMVKRGSQRDPGYAATGAPPALIDGISNLLFIPHTATAWIAAQFVAGHVTQAMKKLLKEMKKETLKRLDIEYALMGVSLLEPTARKLLGVNCGIPLDVTQPFLADRIALFATTTNLLKETTFLLGRELIGEGESFDFVQGALASSAFPAIFAPRHGSDIFPGTGQTNVLFSDGGMFDNLPFIPTIELMAAVQQAHCTNSDPMTFLAQRHASPDLFIAGSLNIPPEEDEYHDGDFDDLLTIHRRASSLKDNIKIRAFQEAADAIHDQVSLLVEKVPNGDSFDDETRKLINGVVEAEILPVFPIDREHLNPTYAFCASVGLKRDRVEKSIVNGCFQTFAALASAQLAEPLPELRQAKRSIDVLVRPAALEGQTPRARRIPIIRWRPKGKKISDGQCPYFVHSRPQREKRLPGHGSVEAADSQPQTFPCPFFEARPSEGGDRSGSRNDLHKLYQICCDDSKQKDAQDRNTRETKSQVKPNSTLHPEAQNFTPGNN